MTKIEKTETRYHMQLESSGYDFVDIVVDTAGRITVKFLDTRWRTPEETIAVFKEIIAAIVQIEMYDDR